MVDTVHLPVHPSIYPGDYEPLPERRKMLLEILSTPKNQFSGPPVVVSKQPGHYSIEIVAPGCNTQVLYIQTVKHHLAISGIIPHPVIQNIDFKVMNAFGDVCFQREIELPEDADLNFVSAEYKDGLLCIHVFRSYETEYVARGEIIVY